MENSWMWSQKPSGLEQPWSNWPKRKAQASKMERFVTSLDATSLSLKFRVSYLTATAGNMQVTYNSISTSCMSSENRVLDYIFLCTKKGNNMLTKPSFDNQNLIFLKLNEVFQPGSSFEVCHCCRGQGPTTCCTERKWSTLPPNAGSCWKKHLFWLGGDCLSL